MLKNLKVQLVICAAVMLGLSYGLWQYTVAVEDKNIRTNVQAMTEAFAHDAEVTFNYAQENLLRFVEQLKIESANGVLDNELFELEAKLYLRDTPALRTIGWTDENFRLIWQTPKDLYPGSVGRSVANSPERAAYLESVKTDGQAYNTGVFVSDRGSFLLALHAPLIIDETFRGVVGGLFETREYFRINHESFTDINVVVSTELGEVYRPEGMQFDTAHPFYSRSVSKIGRSTFNLEAIPTSAYVAANRTNLPATVLGFSLIVSVLTVWALYQFTIIKQTSAKLKRQSMALNQTADAMFIHDHDHIIIDYNAAAVSMYGYSEDELLGMNIRDLAHPSVDFEAIEPVWKRDIERDNVHSQIMLARKKDGALVHASITDTPLLDDKDEHIGVVSMVRDVSKNITERSKLVESEGRFRSLFEGNKDALIIREPNSDGETQVVDINKACNDLLGYSKQEIIDLEEAEILIDPSHLDTLNAAVSEIKQTGRCDDIEVTYLRKDGSPVDVAMSMWRVFDDAGKHLQTITSLRDISQQRRTETRLIEAQRIGQIGSWEWDVASNHLYWSQEMFSIVERDVSLPPMLPNEFDSLIHQDDKAAITQRRDASIRGDGNFKDECRIVLKDGRIKHVRFISKSVFDDFGHLLRRSGTVQDVTTEIEKNADLVRSEKRFRSLFEANQDGIIIYEKGEPGSPFLVDANDAYLSMTGYTVEELRNIPDEDLIASAEDLARIRQTTNQLSNTDHAKEIDFSIRRKDGSTVEVAATIWRVYDDAGNHLQTINAIKDISGQRRAEDRLEEAQRIGQIGSWERDLLTGEYSWSDEMYRIYERDVKEAPFSFIDLENVMHPEDWPELKRTILDFQAQAKPMNLVARLLTKDGGTKYLHFVSKADFFDTKGVQIRRSGTVQDITEQRELEERLHHNDRLQALGQLTSGVAHDFNNILGIISNTAQLLEMDFAEEPQAHENHQRILKAVKRGAGLTDKLLSYSRKQSLKPTDIEAQSFMDEFTSMLGRTLGETVEIDVSVPSESWSVHADENQLTNALLNLALNGRDAMEDGGKLTFTVANWRLDRMETMTALDLPTGDYVAFSVADTGTGMSEETVKKSMEPFFTTKDVGKGSGLGLSMVYGFAEQSGGSVSIKSEVGFGTVVTLLLPGTSNASPSKTEESHSTLQPSTNERRLLIVEDEEELKAVTSQILSRHGYQVTAAGNADEALRLAASDRQFDAALLDVVLPGDTNGIELAYMLRASRPDLKILFCTGYAAEDVLSQLEEIDHCGIFHKPLTISEITERLDSVFASNIVPLLSLRDAG